MNDMARMAEPSILPNVDLGIVQLGEDDFDFTKTVMRQGDNHSPLEILEAIGSIKKSKHATVDSQYVSSLLSQSFLADQLNALQSDPETLGKYIKTFNAYQDDPAYNHLFRKEIPFAGERASVYDLMLLTQRASQ